MRHPGGNFFHIRYLLEHLLPALRSEGFVVAVLVDEYTEQDLKDVLGDVILFRLKYLNPLATDLLVFFYSCVFSPTVFLRANGQLPWISLPCLEVMGVADLNFRWLPMSRVKKVYKEVSYGMSLLRADSVVCVSSFTLHDVETKLSVLRSKLVLLHHGSPILPPPIKVLAPFSQFFITFGHQAHKNVEEILHALSRLNAMGHLLCLVVIGRSDHVETKLKPLVAELGLGKSVWFCGRVSDAELAWLYRESRGLVFMSRFEGFGLPLLEAMVCNCPFIYARATSLMEVAGSAGVGVELGDLSDLQSEMLKLWNDPEHRQRLAELGRRRSSEFSWKDTANRMTELLSGLNDSALGGGLV